MTLDELVAAERRAVDATTWGWSQPKRDRLYAKMRAFSEKVRKAPLPNDVSIDDAWLQLCLRAKDLAGVTDATMFYLTPKQRKRAA